MPVLTLDLPGFEVLESIPDALLIIDAGGKIVYVNAQFYALFGYCCNQVLGSPLDELMPNRFRAAHQSHVVDYVEAPHVRPMGGCSGFYAQHQNGSEFPVEIYLSPFRAGEQLFIMAAVRDISLRKQLEEELRRSRDELDERVKLRTAELEEAARRLQIEMCERARSEERILQLQAELSHISHPSMIGEMTSGLGHELNQPLAAINNYAQGCVRRIHRAAADYVAIEASLDGANGANKVLVRVASPEKERIEIAIVDAGHGLLAESVDHLFQPFFTTKAQGLGMGLSLSHRIVKAHGGQLSARPNEAAA